MAALSQDVTVGIKTFLRKDALKLCLKSLTKHHWCEVIVADDGEISEEKEAMYQEMEKQLPLTLLRLEYDTGLAAGRNEIVQNCSTDYLLMLDDDQTVPDNIGDLKEVLQHNPKIGGVSGIWLEEGSERCNACNIKLINGNVIKEFTSKDNKKTPILKTNRGIRYKCFDFIPNSTLFRIECLRDIGWDPYYKIGAEHIDFYLSHKIFNKWKFAVALDVRIGHHPENNSNDYLSLRHGKERIKASNQYFLDKFGLKEKLEGKYYMEKKGLIHTYNLISKQFKIWLKHGWNREESISQK